MKKNLTILVCLCLLCALAAGCSGKSADTGDFIDLTALSDTLRIAELTNITQSPARYEGKTIRLGGVYQANYYELTEKYYHFILVQDAAACCAQGLEFEWSGEHAYPDDYPEEGAAIELTGVFEGFEELGRTWYRLAVDQVTLAG